MKGFAFNLLDDVVQGEGASKAQCSIERCDQERCRPECPGTPREG